MKTDQICRQCHARMDASAGATACPACGGSLIAAPGHNLDEPGGPPRTVDHRGIVLPPRHAVGGVITPR